MNTLMVNNRSVTFATSWNELKRHQLLYIASRWSYWATLLPHVEKSELFNLVNIPRWKKAADVARLFRKEQLYLLFVLSGISTSRFFNPIRRYLLKADPSQLEVIFKELDWVFKSINLTANLLDRINIGGKRFHGPKNFLSNSSFGEFAFADTYFARFLKGKSDKDMNLFIAHLYRPARKDYYPQSPEFKGDIREDFNKNTVEARAEIIASALPSEKQAVLLYFWGCRTEMEKLYPEVFPKGKKQVESNSSPQTHWIDVITEAAGPKFGTVEEAMQINAHLMLRYLNRKMKEHREQMEEMERKKRK